MASSILPLITKHTTTTKTEIYTHSLGLISTSLLNLNLIKLLSFLNTEVFQFFYYSEPNTKSFHFRCCLSIYIYLLFHEKQLFSSHFLKFFSLLLSSLLMIPAISSPNLIASCRCSISFLILISNYFLIIDVFLIFIKT